MKFPIGESLNLSFNFEPRSFTIKAVIIVVR